LVSLVAVAALLGIAASANKANRTASAEQAANAKSAISSSVQNDKQQPNAPTAAVIVATLTDNVTAATKIAPGGTINYTATITNNGAASPADDATNLNFSGPLDANTTLVAGSVHASPLAVNDTYNWVGNTQLDTVARALPAVTANDVAVNAPGGTDTFTLTAIAGGATALGGVVTLASPSGAFTYTPPLGRPNLADGASVNDTFTYTIANNVDPSLTSTGTVTIALTGRVWYLQAGAAGDGRSNTPSSSPAAMSTAADKSTDVFYIFSNAASLNGPFSVDAGQQLLGQGVNLVVSAITLFNSAAPTPTTTNTAGSCVALAGAPGNNTLSGFNIGNCTGGTAITGANVGTLNVSTMTINTNGGALDLTGVGTPTVSVVLGGTTSTGGAKNVNLVGLNGTITLANGALSGATGNAFDVSGGNATITYLGTISNSGAKQVNIASKTGGSVTFDGAVSGTGTGINLTTNSTGIITFRGGMVLSTGANTAFNATTSGTVNVCDENPCAPGATGALVNTLTTTTGTSLNVSSVTIGANNLEFRSISASGGANGIFLNVTGSSGGLHVTGNGPNIGATGGGVIQNMTGADGSTAGTGVYLNSTHDVQLNGLQLNDFSNFGIRGLSVDGISVTNTTINGISGNNNLFDEAAVAFGTTGATTGITGTGTFTNLNVRGGLENNLQFFQTSGTSNLTFTNLSSHDTKTDSPSFGADGFLLETQSSANSTVLIQSSNFSNNFTQGVQANALDTSTLNMTVKSSVFSSNNEGVVLANSGSGHLTGTVGGNAAGDGNTVTGGIGVGIFVGNAGVLTTSATLVGAIRHNTVTQANGHNNDAIRSLTSGPATGSPSTVLDISNNTATTPANSVGGTGFRAIFVDTPDTGTSPTFDVTVNNNTATTAGLGANAIALQARRGNGDFHVQGNSATATNADGIFLRQTNADGAGNPSTFDLERGVSASNDPTQVTKDNNLAVTGIAPHTISVLGTVTVVNNGAVTPVPLTFEPPIEIASNIIHGFDDAVDIEMSPDVVEDAQFSLRTPENNLASPFEKLNRVQQPASSMTSHAAQSPLMLAKDTIDGAHSTINDSHSVSLLSRALNSLAKLTHSVDSIITPTAYAQDAAPNAPTSGETITLTPIATFPAGGKSITIKYSATVNTSVLTARQATTQGTVTAAGGISVVTDDPEPAGGPQATVTLLDTTLTWTGATDTDWTTATNWSRPGPVVSSYAPGISNTAINDVIIPNVANHPTLPTPPLNADVFSLTMSNSTAGTNTLTINSGALLRIDGGLAGSNLTFTGTQPSVISGGIVSFSGLGPHTINNASGTGSLDSTNQLDVPAGVAVVLNNNLNMGGLVVQSAGTFDLTNRTVSLSGSPVALFATGGSTITTTGSTVIFNGTAAQQAAGIAYNNLTINNTIGLNVTGVTLTGNATVNGTLTLTSSDLATGAFTLTQPNTTASVGVSDVVGSVKRTGGPFAPAVTLTFGNPNNRITFNGAAGTKPTDLTVTLAKAPPATYTAAVPRNYVVATTGGSGYTATLRLRYLDPEVTGFNAEATLNLRRLRTADSHWVAQIPGTVDTVNNFVESATVLAADLPTQWTFSSLSPTAADGVVTGRIVDANGNPVEGAVVRLAGAQNRKFITDANGVYRFDNVETGGLYTVTPSRANFEFNPSFRSFNAIGQETQAIFTAVPTSGFVNPLDTPEYFVRQHYVDFLGREPDEAGFNFWSDQMIECGGDVDCAERRRENVSAAFYLSIEFRKIGGVVDGMYRASYGTRPQFAEFMPDTRTVGQGVRVNDEGWEDKLEANKQAFVAAFVNRAAFHARYDGMDASTFVDALIANTGVGFTSSERNDWVSGLANGNLNRGDVVRSIAENGTFVNAKFNDSFVMMQYFGYLRRDADASGFAFWLNKLNQFNGNFEQAEMVKAFIVSGEYRDRFPR
jgi:hypothetical protein